MVEQYQQGNTAGKKEIFDLYLNNTTYINSWDLVDLSAHYIVGEQLFRRKRSILVKLAHSKSLWERRIAILSTFYFIRQGESEDTLKIAELLLHDSHDLIHKAVGWMLREVGKRCSMESECEFLDKYASVMPRTMLRYAIERFPEELRMMYMKK
jgi:3-methyladenine DNA glycosylase AlkD